MEDYKVLITTSGLGSRLGNLTDYTNKCLVRIADKPAISYIVESYPKNIIKGLLSKLKVKELVSEENIEEY